MGAVCGTVVAITDLGPRIRRVVLDVPQLSELRIPSDGDAALGVYFPQPGERLEDASLGRNYSIRHLTGQQVTFDIVLHTRGLAVDWARAVTVGAQVGLDTARSWYHPTPDAQWQLLVADLSGLPALARIVEELPSDAQVTAIVEVAAREDLDYLPQHPQVRWVTSVGTGNGYAASALERLVREFEHPAGRGYCWFAAEALQSRHARKCLREEHDWARDQYDIVGYWRFDSETWDEKFEAHSDELVAVYTAALADGKSEKVASEEFDLALERAGL